jgi:hypothetical protein
VYKQSLPKLQPELAKTPRKAQQFAAVRGSSGESRLTRGREAQMARKPKTPAKNEMLEGRDSLELGRLIQMIVSDPKMRDQLRDNPAKAVAASKVQLSPETKAAFIDYAKQAGSLTDGVDAVAGSFFFFFYYKARETARLGAVSRKSKR